jgi:hypothetical protein
VPVSHSNGRVVEESLCHHCGGIIYWTLNTTAAEWKHLLPALILCHAHAARPRLEVVPRTVEMEAQR